MLPTTIPIIIITPQIEPTIIPIFRTKSKENISTMYPKINTRRTTETLATIDSYRYDQLDRIRS